MYNQSCILLKLLFYIVTLYFIKYTRHKCFLENFIKEENDFISNLKTCCIFLHTKKDENYIKDMLTEKNSLIFYAIAVIFNLADLAQFCMNYTERRFTVVAENDNFLQLDFSLVKKILQSSKLHITSELEVFNAANDWISIEERSKFAKDVLLTVRHPLLSEPALKYLLSETPKILQTNECKFVVESVLEKNDKFLNKLSSNSFQIRYCDQNLFEILLCEYSRLVLSLKQVNGKDLLGESSMKVKTYFSKTRIICRAVCVNSNIYLFVTKKTNKTLKLKKYSNISKSWEDLTDLDFRRNFCVCVLVGTIYIIGGNNFCENLNSMQYNIKTGETKDIFDMNMQRVFAAGTNFIGKIVVSGGWVQDGQPTNTVEVYDHIADAWSYMPNTVNEKWNHSLVALRSKLFVIGHSNYSYEVYDSTTNKFSTIQSPTNLWAWVSDRIGAVSIGNKIVIFGRKESTVMIYDTDKDVWYEKSCDLFKGRSYTSCIRMPQI